MFESSSMVFKSLIVVTCAICLTFASFIPNRNKREFLKKIEENPKNYTQKTTNPYAETVAIHSTSDLSGLRAKRQNNVKKQLVTDYTISTAFDEDNEVPITFSTSFAQKMSQAILPQATKPPTKALKPTATNNQRVTKLGYELCYFLQFNFRQRPSLKWQLSPKLE